MKLPKSITLTDDKDELEAASFVVCVKKADSKGFPDDVFVPCCKCGVELRQRPHNPSGPPRICQDCLKTIAPEQAEALINSETLKEIRAALGSETPDEFIAHALDFEKSIEFTGRVYALFQEMKFGSHEAVGALGYAVVHIFRDRAPDELLETNIDLFHGMLKAIAKAHREGEAKEKASKLH